MHSRRVPFPTTIRASERADGAEDRKTEDAAERRVVALFGPPSGAPSMLRQSEHRDAGYDDQRRFDAFIGGLCDVFVRGGIAEVRKLALEPASSFCTTARVPGREARSMRSTLRSSRRRSEVDMFLSILGSLERAQRRGGQAEALAEFSRIGRRIAQPGAPASLRGGTPYRRR